MSKKDMPKVAVTFRGDPSAMDLLSTLAKEKGSTVSAQINLAIIEYLSRQSLSSDGFSIGHDDLTRVLPVVKALGAPASIDLFLDLIRTQRAGSKSEL